MFKRQNISDKNQSIKFNFYSAYNVTSDIKPRPKTTTHLLYTINTITDVQHSNNLEPNGFS